MYGLAFAGSVLCWRDGLYLFPYGVWLIVGQLAVRFGYDIRDQSKYKELNTCNEKQRGQKRPTGIADFSSNNEFYDGNDAGHGAAKEEKEAGRSK